MKEIIQTLESVLRALQLANLTSKLMAGVRDVDETDMQTLIRVMNEYRMAKYEGVNIRETGKERENRHC